MEKLWEAVISEIPPWSLLPIAAFALLLFAWPKVRDVWNDVVPHKRRSQRLKTALELQKLLFEVRGLRANSALPEEAHVINYIADSTEREVFVFIREHIGLGRSKEELSRTEQTIDRPEVRSPELSLYRAAEHGALGGGLAAVALIILIFLASSAKDGLPETIASLSKVANLLSAVGIVLLFGFFGLVFSLFLRGFGVRLSASRTFTLTAASMLLLLIFMSMASM